MVHAVLHVNGTCRSKVDFMFSTLKVVQLHRRMLEIMLTPLQVTGITQIRCLFVCFVFALQIGFGKHLVLPLFKSLSGELPCIAVKTGSFSSKHVSILCF